MRTLIVLGSVLAAAAVAAGAFGAHALAARLTPERLATWDTAARYHMLHALAILLVAALAHRLHAPMAAAAGWLFVAGIVVFGGTVYALALGGPRWLGAVTPLGGLAFIAGWLLLAWGALRA
jgi:uncharacterized membrane protein YgdD (TMEM256/DUF423 family)